MHKLLFFVSGIGNGETSNNLCVKYSKITFFMVMKRNEVPSDVSTSGTRPRATKYRFPILDAATWAREAPSKNTLLVKRLTERIPIVNYGFHSETNHIFLGFSKDLLFPLLAHYILYFSRLVRQAQLAASVLKLFVVSFSAGIFVCEKIIIDM